MAPPSRLLARVSWQRHPALFSSSSARHLVAASHRRSIATTSPLRNSWMDKIKGVFTGNKESPSPSQPQASAESFTLLRFADELKSARRLGKFKQYMVGRSSEATFADAFEKQEAIVRVLGGFDASGDNLQTSQKKEAAKLCNCTIADVENALAKFTWAKQAHKKVEKLKEEGKPMPKSLAEVQKLMGSTPLDLARSNLAKSGQISRNALCPCGSGKRYKRYSTTMKVLRKGLRSFYKAESDVLRNMNCVDPRLEKLLEDFSMIEVVPACGKKP